MNTTSSFILLHRVLRQLVLMFLMGTLLCTVAADPRLYVEQGKTFDGFVADLVQREDGTIIVSGDYYPPLSPHQGAPRVPHIAVLDPAGKVLRRLSPPSLSASTDPAQQALGPFVRWRVKAVLTNGWSIVDDDSRLLPRLVLDGDGTPKYFSGEWSPFPKGLVVVESNGAVLMGRSQTDDLGFGAIGRWKLFVDRANDGSWTWDSVFAENVFKAWPVHGLTCARIALTSDGKFWAWLGIPGDPAHLFRFLPDGRPDPSFNPPAPILCSTVDDPFFEDRFRGGISRSSWLGPLPDGGIIFLADNPNGSTTTLLRRLRADGTVDPICHMEGYDDSDRPIATLADGSLLLVNDTGQLLKFTSSGRPITSWHSEFALDRNWVNIAVAKIIEQANGSLILLINRGSRLVSSELLRLRADGSLDPSFDASVIGPTPVPVVRLMATGLQPGHTYTVTESSEQGLVPIPSAGIDYNPQDYTFRGQFGQPALLRQIQPDAAPSQIFWRLGESP